eukprot:3337991-Prymnesium_polylepis.1
MAAAVLASADRLPFPEKPVLATAFCFVRDAHEDYGWWRYPSARQLAGGPYRFRRGPLRSITIKTFAWLITREVYEVMRDDALSGPAPMLALPAGASLHHSLAGCDYCENFCYDHYLEWRWRHASFVCPAVSRVRANFTGGMTEVAGVLASADIEGHHARQRAGIELNGERTRSWQYVDDSPRRALARSVHSLVRWLVPAVLVLCLCSARSSPLRWLGVRAAKVKHEDGEDDGSQAHRQSFASWASVAVRWSRA